MENHKKVIKAIFYLGVILFVFIFSKCTSKSGNTELSRKILKMYENHLYDSVVHTFVQFSNKITEIENDESKYAIAVSYLKIGGVQESIRLTKYLSTHLPLDYRYFFNFAECYEKLGITDSALYFYSETIKLNPKFEIALNNRGLIYIAINNFEKALEDFNNCIEINSSNALYYNNRGLAKASMEDKDGAIKDYKASIYLNQNNSEPYYNYSVTAFDSGDTATSLTLINKAIRLSSDNSIYLVNRGKLYLVYKMLDSACVDFVKSSKLKNEEAKKLVEMFCFKKS